jgi:hypothetical protein
VSEENKECFECTNEIEKCSCSCTYGCEDGYFFGTDTPGFDHINDDPEETYPCPSCNGSGLKRKMTLW